MKKFTILLLLTLYLLACSTKPGPNLSSKAALIQPNLSNKQEVLMYLGPPVQAFLTPDGKEEWYYYYRVRNFWENFLILKDYKGEDYTEILKILFENEKVVDVVYYTVTNPSKQRR